MNKDEMKEILKRLLGILKKKEDMPEDQRIEIIAYCHDLISS